jgi:putative transposase
LSESPSSKGDGREQIIGVLREQEAGGTTGEVCRRHGISPQTFYRWKAKYGGLEVSDAQKLKGLDDENRRLKKVAAPDSSAREEKRVFSALERVAPSLPLCTELAILAGRAAPEDPGDANFA